LVKALRALNANVLAGYVADTAIRRRSTFHVRGADQELLYEYVTLHEMRRRVPFAVVHGQQLTLANLFTKTEKRPVIVDTSIRDWTLEVPLKEAAPSRAATRAAAVFAAFELVLPKRLRSEEIGDAVEIVNRIAVAPTCPHRGLKIAVKVASTIVWLLVNSVREVMSAVWGKKGA
jgi:hypothetical protein